MLPRAPAEPLAQPVVDDQHARRAADPPPFAAALDDPDAARRHRDGAVHHAPVPRGLRAQPGEGAVDPERIVGGRLPVEALEEHRILERRPRPSVRALEAALSRAAALVGGERRTDAQDEAAGVCPRSRAEEGMHELGRRTGLDPEPRRPVVEGDAVVA
jgi:hypothetical protein